MGGRLQEVTQGYGDAWEQISAIWQPFGRLLKFSSGIIGKRPFWAKCWPGGCGREVTGGYGRLTFGTAILCWISSFSAFQEPQFSVGFPLSLLSSNSMYIIYHYKICI